MNRFLPSNGEIWRHFKQNEYRIITIAEHTETGEKIIYQNDRVDAAYHGTGDIFSSTVIGALVQGISKEDSFKLAADYTADTIRATLKNPAEPWYGVDFETTIPELVTELQKLKLKNA